MYRRYRVKAIDSKIIEAAQAGNAEDFLDALSNYLQDVSSRDDGTWYDTIDAIISELYMNGEYNNQITGVIEEFDTLTEGLREQWDEWTALEDEKIRLEAEIRDTIGKKMRELSNEFNKRNNRFFEFLGWE